MTKNSMEDKTTPQYGFYRAEVSNNNDIERKGKVQVWIPDIMGEHLRGGGAWALPGNQAIGGRNDDNKTSFYAGQCIIPPKGSWIWVFFENGNTSRPFYTGALNLQNSLVLPECRTGKKPSDKWVVFKSTLGRCVVISDDPSDCRVEITGKKRQIGSPPDGDKNSVFEIPYNQTTILIDERLGGEQKILIRTYRGDFLCIDVENQNLSVNIKNQVNISATDFNILCDTFNVTAMTSVTFQTVDLRFYASTIDTQTATNISNVAYFGGITNQAGLELNLASASGVSVTGPTVRTNCGISPPDFDFASLVLPVYPLGIRDNNSI